jgi:hypothetical protein
VQYIQHRYIRCHIFHSSQKRCKINVPWRCDVVMQWNSADWGYWGKVRWKTLLGRWNSRCEIKWKLGLSLYEAPRHKQAQRTAVSVARRLQRGAWTALRVPSSIKTKFAELSVISFIYLLSFDYNIPRHKVINDHVMNKHNQISYSYFGRLRFDVSES